MSKREPPTLIEMSRERAIMVLARMEVIANELKLATLELEGLKEQLRGQVKPANGD